MENNELVWVETCDGSEEFGYASQEDADADANGQKPLLVIARRPKQ